MPKKIPPHIKKSARALFEQEGLQRDMVVVDIERRFDKEGKPKTDLNIPGYELSERTVQRWIVDEGWTQVDVSNFPLGAIPNPDAMVSGIKDAVLHYSINVAEDSVSVRDYPGRPIRDTVKEVLEDVVLQARPRRQGVIKFLAERYLPRYIRAYRKSPWGRVLLVPEEQAMIDEVMEEVKYDDE